jgi:Mn2+/Fe2+ NRAMP family transporter
MAIPRVELTGNCSIGRSLASSRTTHARHDAWIDALSVYRLAFSQLILSLQLSFAIVPLLWFTTRRKQLGSLAFSRPKITALWTAAATVVTLNLWLLQRLAFA